MRKALGLVGVGAMALAVLVGCSSPSVPPQQQPSSQPSEPSAPEVADYTGVTLTIWVDQDRKPAVDAAAKAFATATKGVVEVVAKDNAKMKDQFTTAVPTGKGPDMIVGAHDWLGGLIQNGVVQPIDLDDKAELFTKVAVDAFTYDGQTYGVPYAIENIAMVRNTKLAPQAPATWDDMIAAGKAAKTKYPVVVQIGAEGDAYHLYPLQTSFGAPVFAQDASGSYTTTLAMGGEPGRDFAQWLADQGKAGDLSAAIDADKAKAAFLAGDTPFMITGPWNIADIKAANMEFAIDPIPSAGGSPAAPFSGVQGFYVSSKSTNVIAASYFLLNYIATDDIQTQLYKISSRTPALKSAAAAVAGTDPVISGFSKVAAQAVPMPVISQMDAVWKYWGQTEASIISGQSTDAVAAWDTMITAIQADIAKAA